MSSIQPVAGVEWGGMKSNKTIGTGNQRQTKQFTQGSVPEPCHTWCFGGSEYEAPQRQLLTPFMRFWQTLDLGHLASGTVMAVASPHLL
eukprot:6471455-Amphidinium_carterae.1